ncbi:lytic transglycosylase domain-containing protein [Streptomyces sp. NPDC012769]|uniref:lytic transglycosylase domain-containing protein n=1 Tax=Streptomyces sp. NPDC012769 TaxID=3364848 RepID=UPI00369DA83D
MSHSSLAPRGSRGSRGSRWAVRTGAVALALAAAGATQTGTASAATGGCPPYAGTFKSAGRTHGISWQLLSAMAKVESGCNPSAQSTSGGRGLFQMRPATGADLRNATTQINSAAKYLAGIKREVGSRPEHIVAAFNAGVGAVKRYGGVPPYAETQQYVKAVMNESRRVSG